MQKAFGFPPHVSTRQSPMEAIRKPMDIGVDSSSQSTRQMINALGVRAVIFRLAVCPVEAIGLSISRPGADLIGQVAPRGWDRNLLMPTCPTAWQGQYCK